MICYMHSSQHPPEQAMSENHRWLMLLVLFVARTAMAYQFQTIASGAPLFVGALGVDYAVIGTLIGLYMLPGVFLAFAGGLLGQRFGAERLVLVGLALMAGGGVLTAVDSIEMMFVGRVISGSGAVLMNVLMTKMLADWFAGREIVTAMAVLVASWPLGLALALVSQPIILQSLGWRVVMLAGALSAMAALLLVGLFYREPVSVAATPALSSNDGLGIALNQREWLFVSIAGCIWGAYNVGLIVLVSFLPELFTSRGFSLAQAGLIASALGWVLIPSIPLGGYLAERFNRPDVVMLVGFGIVALTAGVLPFLDHLMAAYSLLVLAIGLPAGVIMALPAQALRSHNRAAGMGVYFTCYYAVMALLPAVAGAARDQAGSAAPIVYAAGMMVLSIVGLFAFRTLQARFRPSDA
jgi:cyanate permease